MISKKLWKQVKDRDKGAYCCPCAEEFWVPQHRIGRGLGGSKLLDTFPNLIVMCARHNGAMESDADYAAIARRQGLKVASWEDPESVPVFDWVGDRWLLHDDGTRSQLGGWAV